MQNKTKRLATNAMLAALYFALSMLAVPMGGLKLTFEHLPVIIAAMMFGPVDALIIGALDRSSLGGMNGDISGHMITSGEMAGMLAAAILLG